MQLPRFLSFSPKDPITSATPSKDTTSAPIGAGVAQSSEDSFSTHHHILKWVEETKHKLPRATPALRREAYEADPLLKGTIYPYLKNTLLQGFTVQTLDNKLYSEAIHEITDYLESLDILQVFREDFLNFAILEGHSYRRMDSDVSGKLIIRLEKLDPTSMVTYTDPWDSSIISYHQRARVKSAWSKMYTSTDVDSWFIPYDSKIPDINATYIADRLDGNDQRVKDLFEYYKEKYLISDINNLRIGAAERVIAMHNTERLNSLYYDDDDYERKNDTKAPIDSVLLSIWLKRMLLSNSPNLIYAVLNPFIHNKMGILKEVKDVMGNPIIISSLPAPPIPAEQIGDPAKYANDLQRYTALNKDMKDANENIIKSFKEGGVLTTGPGNDLKPIESARSVPFQLIKGLITQLNEEIGQAFGFPMALILATGTELASSRQILQMFNSVHAGERTEYEAVADKLIKKQFANKSWATTTEEKDDNGELKEVAKTYTFEEIKAHFILDIPDTKNLLEEAQAYKTKAETLTQIKGVGAGKEDLQALGEEYGFGLLALDGPGVQEVMPAEVPDEPEAAEVTAILKAYLSKALASAAEPTDPSGFNDEDTVNKLKEAYKVGQETIDTIFEGQ